MFEWDQTLEEVNIYINLPPNVNSKQFYCKIQSRHVEVGIKGNPPYLNVGIVGIFIDLILKFQCTAWFMIVPICFNHSISARAYLPCEDGFFFLDLR